MEPQAGSWRAGQGVAAARTVRSAGAVGAAPNPQGNETGIRAGNGRAARTLNIAAVAMALFLAWIVFSGVLGSGTLETVPAIIAAVLIVLTGLPLFLTQRLQLVASLVNAAVLTLAIVLGFAFGGVAYWPFIYVPLAFLLWLTAIVPWRVSRGARGWGSVLWRSIGAVLVSSPAVGLFVGVLSGTMGFPVWFGLLLAAVLFAAVAFAFRSRPAAIGIAALGALVAVWAFVEGGMLVGLVWCAGALYFSVGMAGIAAWGDHSATDAEATLAA